MKYLVLFTSNGDNEPDMVKVIKAENRQKLRDLILESIGFDLDTDQDLIQELQDGGNDIFITELSETDKEINHLNDFEIFDLLDI